MRNDELVQSLRAIESRLQTIDTRLQSMVSPRDVRAAMIEATEHATATAESGAVEGAQLDAIVAWVDDRMTGDQLQFSFDDLSFVTKQLASISEGWRTDLLAMRGDVRRLVALCEQALARK
jgi:hypothetical protein